MKKISLLLAMLLCLVPVFSACGANSSPKKAVMQALDVYYGDGGEDVEDYYAVMIDYNLDILELIDDEEEQSDYKEAVRDAQKDIKKSLNTLEDVDDLMEEAELDDYDVSYEVLYCHTYDDKTDTFDEALEAFKYVDTSIEDEITEVAKVGVLITVEASNDDGDFTTVSTKTYNLYKIDGSWYIA